ncbi:endonuclease/exonuclease/phosphatase family protein [Bordetella genomosp. 13]|uniref:endonuclease/exonuclease/phosphatase family protein n=1 Tax=Bordetella genomosp. 13 TaxID=463040 RepID=UPI0011A6327E|nr:endonuclease/exonuclease/phosphatase family protein [Bordetella genomosp. 13]
MNLSTFSIATFNLYNLNLPGLPIYRTDQDGWSQEQYDMKIAWTAHQIGLMQADVVGFQELWHRQVIDDALRLGGLSEQYDLLAPADADGGKIVCGAIVRRGLLVGKPKWIEDFPRGFVLQSKGDDPQTPEIGVNIQGFSRPVLHFVARPREACPDVHFYVCHLKSKRPTELYREAWYKRGKERYARHATALGNALSTIRRTAEAAALRYLLTEQMKQTDIPVVVLGDINDDQHSNTANILTGQPRYLMGDSLGGGDVALYTAQTLQEYRDTRDVYYTHVFQDQRESLDQILVSQEFYDHSRKRIWMFDGMVVNNDHLNFDNHKTSGTNDHGIIRATFRYRPAKG